ncbi:MAG: adenylyltransferase/cytidyltransferase family protein [Candidatus Andersenbacteria bacterium]
MSDLPPDTSFWPVNKILTREQARDTAEQLKRARQRLVTVNGSFDILHAGHLSFLGEAKSQGDILFVGLNSDRSVREKKGQSRPFIAEQERAALVAALACVDYVVIIDAAYDEVPRTLLQTIKPTLHVNGEEYGQPQQWVEWPTMQAVGTAGYVVSRRPALSTSALVNKIKAS